MCQRGPQGFASWCPVDEAPNISKPEPGATDVVDLRQKATVLFLTIYTIPSCKLT